MLVGAKSSRGSAGAAVAAPMTPISATHNPDLPSLSRSSRLSPRVPVNHELRRRRRRLWLLIASRRFSVARGRMLHHVLLLIVVCLLSSNASADSLCASGRSALLAFRDKLAGSGSEALESWNGSLSSSWQGVTLGSGGEVLKLELSSLQLSGQLLPLWEFLPSLQVMNLSHNSLTGRLEFSSTPCGDSAVAALQSLDLSFNRLTGPLREGVRRFHSLRVLHLGHNGLSGELPRGFFQLRSLQALDLSWNNFTGSVSTDLELLRELELVSLAHNNFSGMIPAANLSRMAALASVNMSLNSLDSIQPLEQTAGSFQQLRTLDLSSNKIAGNLPDFAFAAAALEVLNLSSNQFSGAIPVAGRSLRVLDLASNALTDDLRGIVEITSLENINLAGNNLSGTLPPELRRLANLTVLDLCKNRFQGPIPDSISDLTKLEHLKVSSNQLSSLPDIGVSLPDSLKVLSAGSNLFSGPLRISYNSASRSRLEILYLSDNRFTGPIPEEVGQLKNLKRLVLNQNGFQGSVPASLAHCELLEEIWINDNRLTGRIPPELFTLRNLRSLVLANNSLSGSPIPHGISQCKTLEVLWLEQNNFSGPISSEVGQLSNLLMLSLASNKLTGHIPASLGKLSSLVGLDLGSNALSGRIPDELAGLSSVQFFFLTDNRMEQQIPAWFGNFSKLRALDLSFNNFSGGVPSSWKNSTLTSLSPKYSDKPPSALVYNNEGQKYVGYALPTTLDFSHNALIGIIPAELGVLRNLQILNLSHNQLHGEIPPTLGDVPALLKLDLSENNLTGTIPPALCKLTFLSGLNLSYNNLQGAIPSSAQFQTFGVSSFVGNPGLCGRPLPTCQKGQHHLDVRTISAVQKLIPLYIVIAGSLGFCGFWALFIVLIRKRQKLLSQDEEDEDYSKKKHHLNSSEMSTMSEGVAWINPKELMSATGNYSHANIIGDGGFGIVYKATLADGSAVAVKKLITDGGFGMQGEREFLAEMQTLGKIKHKNLVCLRGYCCDGKDRILVYKYLKNGSLDTWLHCREPGVKPLDWKTRFRIILGAARGIAFLHQECFPPIVHRDIKASNILLDEDFEAHMADFGLARLMRDAGDTHVSTDVAGTVGYIPPEYNSSCIATMRGDVYSFGVVVLETIMGKRPTDKAFRRAGGIGHLAGENVSVQELHSVIDAALLVDNAGSHTNAGEISFASAEILEVMKIACLCCVEKPGKRPEMTHVVRMLEGVERRHSSSATSLVTPPYTDGGSKHFLNNVEI